MRENDHTTAGGDHDETVITAAGTEQNYSRQCRLRKQPNRAFHWIHCRHNPPDEHFFSVYHICSAILAELGVMYWPGSTPLHDNSLSH